MDEVVMESAEGCGCQAQLGVAEAWENVTAALVRLRLKNNTLQLH